MVDIKEVYQELYTSNNSYFFRAERDKNAIPFFIAIGIKGRPFEEDLVIPVTKDYLTNLTIEKFLQDQIVDKDEDTILESLQLYNIIDFDKDLNIKLRRTFNSLKDVITDSSAGKDIYSKPLNFDKWELKGHLLKEKRVEFTDLVLLNLAYIEINSPWQGCNNIKQYIVRFKIDSYIKSDSTTIENSKSKRIVTSSRYQLKFGPFETPVNDYTNNKKDMMKMPVVKKRIDERKKWLEDYSDEDILFLIFSPIRFLRFAQMQNRLKKEYTDKGSKKTKPSVIKDIRENALFNGVWDYKDLEYLLQIDLFVENGILVPTDFNYCSPPYAIVYKAVKDGILIVGGIEHPFQSPKGYKQGHFITYMNNKKMGREGTQVLIKYRNELGNTNKMLTCAEMDMEIDNEHRKNKNE